MQKLLVKKVDVFTDTPLSGNPANVVHGADKLSEPQMQALARELGLVETAFIMEGSEEEGTEFRLRYFTPAGESKEGAPSHATLAAYHSLVEEKVLALKGPVNRFTHANGNGTHEVEVRPRGSFEQIMVTAERPTFGEAFDDPEKLLKALGLEKKQLRKELPLLVMNDHTVMVALDGMATLEALAPDLDAVAKLKRKHKLLHVAAFTTETKEMASNYHLRVFAPALGFPEDPVTPFAHARLAAYLVRHKVVKATTGGLTNLTGEQGHSLGRPGRVVCEVRSDGAVIKEVRVGGTAVTAMRGEATVA